MTHVDDQQGMEDLFNQREAEVPKGSGFTREVKPQKFVGRPANPYDRRKYKYDVVGGRKKGGINWSVSKDDRMPADEAGHVLDDLHVLYGVDRENPEILLAFDNALFFCHTMNSGSVLQPGRATFTVAGTQFEFAKTVSHLQADLRRFFRAFADDIRDVNRQVLDNFKEQDVVSVEQHTWLLQVAQERGLSRFPDLAHDSSEACTLTMVERSALAKAKQDVITSSFNAADRVTARRHMPSADGYDSTNQVHVTGAARDTV